MSKHSRRSHMSYAKWVVVLAVISITAVNPAAAQNTGSPDPPADDYVERHIVGNTTANDVFKLGKVVGSSYFHVGAAVGLWVVGRYIVPPGPDGSRTNKASHLGFDLIRAQIVTQAVVQGMKFAVRRDRPTGECCAFPSGHAASAFAAASVLQRHLGY